MLFPVLLPNERGYEREEGRGTRKIIQGGYLFCEASICLANVFCISVICSCICLLKKRA